MLSELPEFIKSSAFLNFKTEISYEIAENLADLVRFLLSENKKYNLTGIKDENDAAFLNVVDSLALADIIGPSVSVVDVGSGAGFPALPLALTRPDINVCALDSTAKKTAFIESAGRLMKLSNIRTKCGRAELLSARGSDMFGAFDYVTARAVASASVLCEISTGFLKVGGKMLLMKGPDVDDELWGADACVLPLGLELSGVRFYTIRNETSLFKRSVAVFTKIKTVKPDYPRRYSLIKSKPLFGR